jgi:selenocysteine lyase/cysteine desulfurase
VAFVAAGVAPEAVVRHLDGFNIGIRWGDFYAKRLIEALDLHHQGGVVRVSIAHYNTLAEIDRLIQHLEEVLP